MMSKLTRATVPMCPKKGCGAELTFDDDCYGEQYYDCAPCGHAWIDEEVHWGLCIPDVEGVAGLMRSVAGVIVDIPGARDQATRLNIMADKLEGKS